MIKNFRKLEKLRPHVEVKIGGLCPVGCKNKLIYHESVAGNRCVNTLDGECPYITKKSTFWQNKQKVEILCPNRKKESEGCTTRPFQLGYFDIPEQFATALNLPPRPTEIPGIVLMSAHDFSNSMYEPLTALYEYPVLDFYLAWWKATALVCKGDGESATWYPASPEHQDHMKPRKCLYAQCPDFHTNPGGQCKEVAELYFRIPNAPGFPAMWRIMTRSKKVIQYALSEIEQLHNMLNGRVSFVPLVLSLELETGRPIVKGQRMQTEVYRIHLRTAFTMIEAMGHVKSRELFLGGGDIKLLAEATPDMAPAPTPPVECHATAPAEQWNDDEPGETAAGDTKAAAPATAPAKKEKPAAAAKQAPVDKKSGEDDIQARAETFQDDFIKKIGIAKTLDELRKLGNMGLEEFKKSFPGIRPERMKEAFYANKERLLAGEKPKPAAAPAPAAAGREEKIPDPEPPADLQKAAAPESGGSTNHSKLLERVLYFMEECKPAKFSLNQALDMFGHDRLEDFTDMELQELITIAEENS